MKAGLVAIVITVLEMLEKPPNVRTPGGRNLNLTMLQFKYRMLD